MRKESNEEIIEELNENELEIGIKKEFVFFVIFFLIRNS